MLDYAVDLQGAAQLPHLDDHRQLMNLACSKEYGARLIADHLDLPKARCYELEFSGWDADVCARYNAWESRFQSETRSQLCC
jgi:hypothetical protein